MINTPRKKVTFFLFTLLIIGSTQSYALGEVASRTITSQEDWNLAAEKINVDVESIPGTITLRKFPLLQNYYFTAKSVSGVEWNNAIEKSNVEYPILGSWLQTSQQDFQSGIEKINVDVTSSPGDIAGISPFSSWVQTTDADFMAAAERPNILIFNNQFRLVQPVSMDQFNPGGIEPPPPPYPMYPNLYYSPKYQSFICTQTGYLNFIDLFLTPNPNLNYTIKVSIHSDVNNSPNLAYELGSTVIGLIAGTPSQWFYAFFYSNNISISLHSNTKYWICIKQLTSTPNNPYTSAGLGISGNAYNRGEMWDPNISGGIDYGRDILFHEYVIYYFSTGDLISQAHYFGENIKEWGTLETIQYLGGQTINWFTQVSDDGVNWDPEVPVGIEGKINSATKKYMRWHVHLVSDYLTTPVVDEVTVNVKYYSWFLSQSHYCGDIISWGKLEYAQNIPPGTSISYVTQTSDDGINWDSEMPLAPDGTIQSAIKKYIRWKAYLNPTTENTPRIHSVALNWIVLDAVGNKKFSWVQDSYEDFQMGESAKNIDIINEVGNIQLGKLNYCIEAKGTASAFSNPSISPASNAIDGSLSTGWSDQDAGLPQWLEVEFQELQTIIGAEWELMGYGNAPGDFSIQYYENGMWQTAISASVSRQPKWTGWFQPHPAKKWRIWITTAQAYWGNGDYPVCIEEFRLFAFAKDAIYTSISHDCGNVVSWGKLECHHNVPPGTSIIYTTQTSNDGVSWDSEMPLASDNTIQSAIKRYIKWKAYLYTTRTDTTPVIDSVAVEWFEASSITNMVTQPDTPTSDCTGIFLATEHRGEGADINYQITYSNLNNWTLGAFGTNEPDFNDNKWDTIEKNGKIKNCKYAKVKATFRSMHSSAYAILQNYTLAYFHPGYITNIIDAQGATGQGTFLYFPKDQPPGTTLIFQVAYSNQREGPYSDTSFIENFSVLKNFPYAKIKAILETSNPEFTPILDGYILTYPVYADTIPPQGSVIINNGETQTDTITVTLNLSATDETSGVAFFSVSNFSDFSSASTFTYIPENLTLKWNLTPEEGKKNVYVKFYDYARNFSTISSSIGLTYVPTYSLDIKPIPSAVVAGQTSSLVVTLSKCTPIQISPVENASINFIVTSGGGSLNISSAITDKNGQATATLVTGMAEEPNTVHISSAGIAGDVSVYGYTSPEFTVTVSPARVFIGDTAQVSVSVVDSAKSSIKGMGVYLKIPPLSSGNIIPEFILTNENGVAISTFFAGTTTGKSIVKVFIPGLAPKEIELEIFSASLTAISSPSSMLYSKSSRITPTLLDHNGFPIPGVPVHFSVIEGGGSVEPSWGLTNSNGQVNTTFSGATPGTNTIHISTEYAQIDLHVEGYLPVLTLKVFPSAVIWRGEPYNVPNTSTITVRVTDRESVPLQNVQVNFCISKRGPGYEPYPDILSFVSPDSNVTDSNGCATTTFFSGHFYTENVEDAIKTTVKWYSYESEETVTIITYQAPGVHFSAEASPSELTMGKTSAIKVSVKDEHNVPIKGMLVYFTILKGDCTLDTTFLLTDKDGYATATLTPVNGGGYQIRTQISGLDPVIVDVWAYFMGSGYLGRPVRGTQRLLRDCVNTASGNLSFAVQDFSIPGRGPYPRFFRTYNSFSSYFGPLGDKWTHNYNMRVFPGTNGCDWYFMDEYGNINEFKYQPDGSYKSSPGVHLTFYYDYTEGRHVVKDKTGTRYFFESGGHGGLVKIVDRNNNITTLTYFLYNPAGYNINMYMLSTVTDPAGRVMSFSYTYVQRTPGHIPYVPRPEPIAITAPFLTTIDGPIKYPTFLNFPEGTPIPTGPTYVPVIYAVWYMGRMVQFNYSQIDSQGDAKLTGVSFAEQPSYQATYQYQLFPAGTHLVYVDDPHAASGNAKLRFAYDDFGRVNQIQDASGNPLSKLEYTLYREGGWDTPAVKTKITQIVDAGTSYTTIDEYNTRGFQVRITDPLGSTTECEWDEDLNRKWIKDKRGYKTYFNYDSNGNCTQTIDAMSYSTYREYEPNFNNMTKLTDAKGRITKCDYNPINGNLTKVTERYSQSGEKTTEYRYEGTHPGDCTTMVDANGHITTYGYNSYGNQNRVTVDPDGLNITTNYVYDNLSRLIQVIDSENRITEYQWNSWDRKTKVIYHEETETTEVKYEYDPRGRRSAIIDQLGHRTEFEYDEFDQLKIERRYKEGMAVEANYTYDLAGNRKIMTDPRGKATNYTYDVLNRLVETRDPLISSSFPSGRPTIYHYNIPGIDRPTDIDYPNGNKAHFEYDPLYRLIETKNSSDPNQYVHYEYDEVGNRTFMIEPRGTTEYGYDDHYRLASVTYPPIVAQGFSLAYSYDNVGNRKTMTTSISNVSYNYDSADRLISSTHSKLGPVSFTYDKAGNRKTMAYPNNIATTHYTYDKRDRITNMAYKNKFNSIISNVNYTYDAGGNRKTMTDELGTTNYEYDSLNQLTKVITPRRGNQEYDYDLAGNRTHYSRTPSPLEGEGAGEGEVNYTYDDANQLLSTVAQGFSPALYSYDANGNLISKVGQGFSTDPPISSGGNLAYEWDYQNRLVKVFSLESGIRSLVSEFSYDGDGKRVQKQFTHNAQPTTVNYLYDGMDVILETDGNNNINKEYFVIVGEIICKEEKLSSGITTRDYMLHDYLGSTVFVLDEAGNILSNYYYEPFGECWNGKDDPSGNIKFTGKEYEEGIGLYYFATRWYDPGLGRFISQDPAEPLAYIYCANNPMRYVDPMGLGFWEAVGKFFSEIGESIADTFKTFKTLPTEAKKRGEDLASEAKATAAERYEGMSLHNTEADAYRHALWGALMTKELGSIYAQHIGIGYEIQELGWNIKHPEELKMDLYNNAVGRRLALDPRCPKDPSGIADFIYQNREKLQISPWTKAKPYKY